MSRKEYFQKKKNMNEINMQMVFGVFESVFYAQHIPNDHHLSCK